YAPGRCGRLAAVGLEMVLRGKLCRSSSQNGSAATPCGLVVAHPGVRPIARLLASLPSHPGGSRDRKTFRPCPARRLTAPPPASSPPPLSGCPCCDGGVSRAARSCPRLLPGP